MAFFTELEQKIQNFVWRNKSLHVMKAILRDKTELEESGSLNSDSIKKLQYGTKQTYQCRMTDSPEINPCIYSQLFLFSRLVMSDSLWPHGLQYTSPVPHHLPKFAQVHVHFKGNAIQLSHLLTPSSPSALNLSQHQRLFSESAICIRLTKCWSLSFNISPSNEYSGLISLEID